MEGKREKPFSFLAYTNSGLLATDPEFVVS
jgi:hypothetical protein